MKYKKAYDRLTYRLELMSDDIACAYENGDKDELRSSICNLLDLASTAISYGELLALDDEKCVIDLVSNNSQKERL